MFSVKRVTAFILLALSVRAQVPTYVFLYCWTKNLLLNMYLASRVNFSWSQVSTVARIPYSKTIYAILKTIMYTAKCLTASSNTDGATVTIQTCIDSEAQKWTFTGGAVQTFGDKCLDVTNGNNADGTKLQIWPCTPNDINQQFSYTVSYSL